MTLGEHLATSLQGNFGMLKWTLSDFSDADLLARPVPKANHTNWQLGHLVVAETQMLSKVGAKMPELPAGFVEKYTKETSASDDAAKFLKKDQLLSQFEKTRAAAATFAKSLSAEQLAAPGPEAMRQWAPTVADVISMQMGHLAMHVGQFQVIRRKLGKPILF